MRYVMTSHYDFNLHFPDDLYAFLMKCEMKTYNHLSANITAVVFVVIIEI